MTTTGDKDRLDVHEARYLRALPFHWRDLSSDERSRMHEVAAAHLGERPPAESWDSLVDDLGDPANYASQLRAASGLDDHPGQTSRPRTMPKPLRFGLFIIPVGLVAALVGAWSWWTANPGIHNSCGGAHSPDPNVRVEHRTAAGTSEQLISYVDGAEVTIFLCLSADHAVRIEDVRIPTAQFSLFNTTGARAQPSVDGAGGGTVPLRAFVLDPNSDDPRRRAWNVDVVGALRNCERHSPGGGVSFDSAEVTYRYRGRTAQTTVDLPSTYSFISPPTSQCPRPREAS